MDDLYQAIILDHVDHPRNFGVLEHPTHTVREANASCGDMVEAQLSIKNGKIAEVKWRGVGCAISTASMSMLSEMMIGKTLMQVKKITEKQLMKEMGLKEILPTREKCLVLPLKLLQKLG